MKLLKTLASCFLTYKPVKRITITMSSLLKIEKIYKNIMIRCIKNCILTINTL